MKEYRKESVCAPLFKLLEALFELFVPLVMARIIDIGIANGDRGYIVRMCLVMAALGLIGTDLLHYRTVFCGKGCGRICGKGATRTVCTHSEPVFFRDGCLWYFNLNYADDK